MQQYKDFQPTGFDSKGAFLEDQQDWLVAPVLQTRDSDCLSRSNFKTALEMLRGESETVEVHRFGHWGPGWFEIIVIDPSDSEKVKIAEDIESSLSDYPILDEEHFSALETDEANEVWKNCYNVKERIAYIREHESQFDFNDYQDMISCVRGEHFYGYASELID